MNASLKRRVGGFPWKSQNVTGVDVGSRLLKAVTLRPGATSILKIDCA